MESRATLGQHEVQKQPETANAGQSPIVPLTCGFMDFQRRPTTPRSLSQGGSAGSNPVGGTRRKRGPDQRKRRVGALLRCPAETGQIRVSVPYMCPVCPRSARPRPPRLRRRRGTCECATRACARPVVPPFGTARRCTTERRPEPGGLRGDGVRRRVPAPRACSWARLLRGLCWISRAHDGAIQVGSSS